MRRLAAAVRILIGMWGAPVIETGGRAHLFQKGEHADLLGTSCSGSNG